MQFAESKKELCEAPENSPASWCKKSESKGAVVPPADFLLEAESRGSPPKSEKRQLLGTHFKKVGGSGAGGVALLREESNKNSGKGIAESSTQNAESCLDSANLLVMTENRDSSPTAQNDKVKNSQNLLFKSLIISLVAHLIALFALYFFAKNMSFLNEPQMQKVKLSFKRGGDSAMKDSPHKHNSSIPQNLPNSAPQNHAQNPAQSPINLQNLAQISPNPAESSADSAKNNAKNPADSASNALNLASLQVYNNANLNPNLPEQKRKEMINYIASKAIPSDIKAEIFDLYGDELGDYGFAEIDFIINNLRNIGRITQYHINRRGYPQSARLLKQQGKNVIEFYLHPNGDISELRVVSSANSIILDNDMLTNIKIAFREYPRPTSKVKIRFYMTYMLY